MPAEVPTKPTFMIFDSGVGGLTIYQEIRRLLPAAEYIYASDNEAFPYGTKEELEVVARVNKVLHRLMSKYLPDLLVVACNTASTVALPKIRDSIAIPVVGVVPAIKPAAALSRTKVIGLLATPGTVQRAYTQNLIDEFARDCTVVRVGSSELVGIAEDKLRGRSPNVERVRAIIAPLFGPGPAAKLDAVVLGCTHFPLLKDELMAAAPREVIWMDSGRAIAKRVRYLLRTVQPISQRDMSSQQHRAVFTARGPDSDQLQPVLKELGFLETQFLKVDGD